MMSLWWIVFFELGAVGLFVFFLLRRYISWRKTPWYASVLTFLGWFLAMSIAVMLPIDISSTAYEQCLAAQNNSLQGATKVQDQSTQLLSTSSVSLSFNSISYTGQTSASTSLIDNSSESKDFPCFDLLYIEKHILVICWNILYWATFLLCWFVYPVMQSYSTAGDFSIPGKFWTAIKDNIIFYIIGGAVLGLFLVIFLVLSSDGNWFGVAMSCSNAYGLILYLVLLSYGLVLLPRKFWRKWRQITDETQILSIPCS
ncbi:LMBR1-like membrane protein [Pelomyxa schiedti]|nr:LMBR1-like membrane protein [Pelomyxa schiedti]